MFIFAGVLQVLKASAGSGKTYALAREYLRLILMEDKPDAYRHVLAVTFTNKATDEMKRRILKELYLLSREPEKSPYFEELGMDATTLQRRARQQLSGILNDYSAFAVSTIDRFFQQTLRAFSREIGQFSSYQVQLDREALVSESVDRLLDSLTEDNALLGWLTRSVQEDLESSGKFSLEGRLQEVAGSLQELPGGKLNVSKESLAALRKLCKQIEKSFLERVEKAAADCLKALSDSGVDPADSNRGFLTKLYKYQHLQHPVEKPTDAFLRNAAEEELWFSKAKAGLRQQLAGALDRPLEAFVECFDKPYTEYQTARTIQGQLYSLGVAGELRDALTEIQKEKNLLSIDDSNTILKQIIDGTDTPFIYEKLGVRFDDFLLDEFQDTADVQWENFRPLLHNSDDQGKTSLIVGDVKQSIYRWRGSDWNLLGSRLEKEFRQTRVEVLDSNYRTCGAIVHFNNDFFAFAAGQLDRLTGAEGAITRLYEGVDEQKVKFQDPAPGSVEVRFVEDQEAEILQTLQDLHSRGARWADVAILVRGNAEGAAIASALVAAQIPVVSDDSLFVKASVTVRRLISQLSLMDAPLSGDKTSVAGYLASSLEVRIPERYHSLMELAETLLRDLRGAFPETFEAEVPYIQSFMDYLQDWVSINGNNLDAFLRAWADAQPKIASPATGDSVRVMTIHKSKGLEFPFVIVPYAEKVTLYKASSYWCTPKAGDSALAEATDGLYRVSLDSGSADTFFADDYRQERILQAIDNLNVFYVALTRPKYGLKIISARPPKKIADGSTDWKNLSQLLYTYLGGSDTFIGTPYNFGQLKREAGGEAVLETGYPSYPAEAGNRLRISPEAADYFGEDGSFGPAASHRIRGNVLHGILARTVLPEDLPEAVEAAVGSGELPRADARETLTFLQERIASVEDKGWFSPDARYRIEVPVIATDGEEYRPDRVVLPGDGSACIIDYKFGKPEDHYIYQVRRYLRLYKAMGYAPVSGALWYLFTGEITNVNL